MKTDIGEFGNIVKILRKRKGYTQEALAERLNTSTRYLQKIENENAIPGRDLLVQLSNELGFSMDDLYSLKKPIDNTRKERLIEKIVQCNDDALLSALEITVDAIINLYDKKDR